MSSNHASAIARPTAACAVAASLLSLLLATTPASAADVPGVGTPAAITREPLRSPDDRWVVQGATGFICDQMSIVSNVSYDAGNGNAMSGAAAFGVTVDAQLADDCDLPSTLDITNVCGAFLTLTGAFPASGLWVQVYPDVGGMPRQSAEYDVVVSPAQVTGAAFTDPVFGLEGLFLCGTLPTGELVLTAGRWWFDIQPVDTTASGDAYYQVRDFQYVVREEAHAKDGAAEHGTAFGGPYPGAYGTSSWASFGSLGLETGDAAFAVLALVPVDLQSFTIE